MAKDLTREKVKQDLKEDINFYNEKISEKSEYVDDTQDQVEIEKMRREREQRELELKNIQ